jgi:pantothenate kinase
MSRKQKRSERSGSEQLLVSPGLYKMKSYTPNPRRTKNVVKTKGPYLIGICGGPSSGMSTVADNMLKALNDKAGIVGDVIHQFNFYKPMRGNMRRPRAMSN